MLPLVKERLAFFNDRGIKPTLRAMFYALVSLGPLPNTINYYDKLSDYTARWREAWIIPMDCFIDENRRVVEIDDIYESPQEYIDRHIKYLEDAPTDYFGSIPKWYGQREYVEVWTEKNAQVGILRSILRNDNQDGGDRYVRIVPTGGFGSVTFGWNNAQRLKRIQELGKNIHILYFGDLDPSGESIEKVATEKLRMYGVNGIDFRRVALTDEQVETHKHPRKPDSVPVGML
jgi:hypothetical protein